MKMGSLRIPTTRPWIVVSFFLLTAGLYGERISSGDRTNPDFSTLISRGTEFIVSEDSTRDIRLKPRTHTTGSKILLILDFENHVPEMLKDEAGNYRIEKASYIRSRESRSGKNSALFQLPGHGVNVASPEELWPGVDWLTDFTIETWIKPNHYFRENHLFEKSSFFDGYRRGLSIDISNGKVLVRFLNMMEDRTGNLYTFTLSSHSKIPLREWTHIAISYNASEGKIILYINGKEERVLFAKRDGEILRCAFHSLDRSPLVVGGLYSGLLDDFVLTGDFIDRHNIDQLRSTPYRPLQMEYTEMVYSQETGEAISDVISLAGYDRPGRTTVNFSASEAPGTKLEFYVRYANRPFSGDLPDRPPMQWRYTENGAIIPDLISHIQWKVVLRADAMGKESPVLHDVSFDFRRPISPSRPQGLHPIDALTAEDTITLAWNINPEAEIQTDGGYIVYYGLKPGEYTGKIKYRQVLPNKFPIQQEDTPILSPEEERLSRINPSSLKGRPQKEVRIRINNRLIQDNILAHEKRERMPFLNPGFTYYFAVAAYTKSGGESELSKEIPVTLDQEPDLPLR